MNNGAKNGPPTSGNQYDYWSRKLRPEIDAVCKKLAAGTPASVIANGLLREHGLGTMQIVFVFKEATGVELGDLKSFGQWWDDTIGVTDTAAFDAWATEVFRRTAHRSGADE